MKRAVYAGSFDPITNGHLSIVEMGAELFDELTVAIGTNPDKKSYFPLEERLEMLKMSLRLFQNVRIDSFQNQYLVNYASSIGAKYILRGIRSGADYEYERSYRHINNDLNPNIKTVFLMPDRPISEISSSFVRGLMGYDGWEDVLEKYVPRYVYNKFLIRFEGLKKRWESLWQKIGASGNGNDSYMELLSLYGENHRAYHNFVHVASMLREFDEVRDYIENPEQFEIAIWYHDAIYNTKEKNNEEKSAELAQKTLIKAGIKPEFINNVTKLILATKHQETPQKTDEQYLIDLDLSILRESQREFDEYELDVREEYSWVPEETFKAKRAEILQFFLDRDNIYLTELFRNKYKDQAIKNLTKSIEKLKS